MKDFGARLKALREARGLDQPELADTDNPKQRRNFGRYVSKLETGKECNPSLHILERLAAGFGLSLSGFVLQLENISTSSDLTRHGLALTSEPSTEGISLRDAGTSTAPKGVSNAGASEAHHISADADSLRDFQSRLQRLEESDKRLAKDMARLALKLVNRDERRDRSRPPGKAGHAKSKKSHAR